MYGAGWVRRARVQQGGAQPQGCRCPAAWDAGGCRRALYPAIHHRCAYSARPPGRPPTCSASRPSSRRMRLLAMSRILRLARLPSPSSTSIPLWLRVGGQQRQPAAQHGWRGRQAGQRGCPNAVHASIGPAASMAPLMHHSAHSHPSTRPPGHPPQVQLFERGAVLQPRHAGQPVALQAQPLERVQRGQPLPNLRDAVAPQPQLLQQRQVRQACASGGPRGQPAVAGQAAAPTQPLSPHRRPRRPQPRRKAALRPPARALARARSQLRRLPCPCASSSRIAQAQAALRKLRPPAPHPR